MKKLLSIAASIMIASIFFACSKDGINASDANRLISGPNSIKGTISGTMRDTAAAFSFPFDYHYTANDGNSSSESWIDNTTGDTLGYVWQYFYFDRNGYNDYGDSWSPSGQFLRLDFEFKKSVVKNVTTLTWRTIAQEQYQRVSGMWQNMTSKGNRFVYGTMYYYGWNTYSTPPTMNITDLKYDNGSQILSGKLSFAIPANSDISINSGNKNATTITADFRVYFPRENFLVTKKSNDWGMVYRAGK